MAYHTTTQQVSLTERSPNLCFAPMVGPSLDVWFIAGSDVEFRPVDAGGLLVDVHRGVCFQLNRVGAELWRSFTSGLPLAGAISAVKSRYDASTETIVADALSLCEQLTAAGLLRPAARAAPVVQAQVPHGFALETLNDGAILLDLNSGVLSRLNGTAALVWQRTLAGDPTAAIAVHLAGTYAIPFEKTAADVGAALQPPTSSDGFRPAAADFRYDQVDGAFRFSLNSVPVLEVRANGSSIRTMGSFASSDLGMYLRAFSPKVLSLRGGSTLHGSAVVRTDGQIVAFLGSGGAGKTSTAQAFEAAGWKMIAEDKVVLRAMGNAWEVAVDGEREITDWVSSTRSRLMETAVGTWVETCAPASATTGLVAPLADIMLIDQARRWQGDLRTDRLGATTAAGEIFRHGFYGSPAPDEWRRNLLVAATLARSARTYQATVPEGLTELRAAVLRYTATMAS